MVVVGRGVGERGLDSVGTVGWKRGRGKGEKEGGGRGRLGYVVLLHCC